ncbi:hypothetical protein GCM10023166_23670 [Paeniglutamicibacter cryotolerans]
MGVGAGREAASNGQRPRGSGRIKASDKAGDGTVLSSTGWEYAGNLRTPTGLRRQGVKGHLTHSTGAGNWTPSVGAAQTGSCLDVRTAVMVVNRRSYQGIDPFWKPLDGHPR